MTLRECYEAFGGNYDDAVSRLMNESLIRKMLVRFLEDKSFGNLVKAMEEGNDGEAFRMAHTLKGVCGNLGFHRLYESSSMLTEALRGGRTPEADDCLERVSEDYREVCRIIGAFSGTEKQ